MDQAEEWPNRTVEYRVFKGQEADFKPGEKEGEKLVQAIEGFLSETVLMKGDREATDGLTIKVRSAWGAEQLFLLTGNVLKYESDGPTYDMARGQVLLPQLQVEAVNGLLRRVKVGPVPAGPIGLDGETTIVTIREGQNRVALEYWDAPKPWKPLAKLVEMMRELAEKAIAKERYG